MTKGMAALSDRFIFFVGVNTGFVTDGRPDARYVDFYRRRSSPELHCAIVGNVAIPGGHGSNHSTPTLDRAAVWTELAEAIHAEGSLAGIQLATAWAGYEGQRKFVSADGAAIIDDAKRRMRNLALAELDRLADAFDDAAMMAVEHGFEHVQVHAAHGYLPSLLIDDRINPQAALIKNRLGKLAERLRVGGIETSIRISMRTGDSSFDLHGRNDFIDSVAILPFDFIDLSSGFYNIDKRLIYPSRPEMLASRFAESLAIARRHPDRRFIVSGAIGRRSWELPANIHLGICRDLIANPRALVESENGCRNYGKCHYHSRGGDHLTCPRWLDTGGGLERAKAP